MPRPIEYDREDVLQKAMQLFWLHGYEQTSVRDVLDSTGFNRHSLYEEFGGKDGLFKEVLEYYKQNIAAQVIAPLMADDSDLNTIRNIFKARASHDQRQLGCLFTNTANVKQCLDDELFDLTKSYNRKVEKAFQTCISNAQVKGQVPKDKDAKLLARFVSTVFHGLSPMNKLGITKNETITFGEMTINAILTD